MTIQLPVLLWTVITFCLFAFVVNRLLFKPLLAFMDQRQARIDAAAQKKAEYDRALVESEQKLEAFRAEESRYAAQCAKDVLDLARHDADAVLGEAATARMRKISEHRAELGIEHHEIEETLEARVEKLAAAYISTLVS